jgi:hypothetical protein
MRTLLASAALALIFGFGLPAQSGKKATGPIPPALSEPGVAHPMPIPESDPPIRPEVRKPVHETGREKAVSSRSRSKGAEKKSKSSVKVEQNGQVGGAQDAPRRKKTEKAQSSESQRP